ncbi:MAG: D-sedoheptulose 7-phosphate isomerase [Desulfohalobiaceae bacterium]|nr:D-sedoheptulose 7-phosphate isomerase [Desulfohalobiaceae bacterium]
MTQAAVSRVEAYGVQGARLRQDFFSSHKERLVEAAGVIAGKLEAGGKLLLCGNGGSAADAQHLAAEFVSRFQRERPSLAALALTTDTSVLTAISNDYGFDQIFRKQIQGLAGKRDVLLAFSTSGSSPNVLQALTQASEIGLKTIGMVGKNGDLMRKQCDYLLQVQSAETPLIQEVHIAAGHMLCSLVEYFLFEAKDRDF